MWVETSHKPHLQTSAGRCERPRCSVDWAVLDHCTRQCSIPLTTQWKMEGRPHNNGRAGTKSIQKYKLSFLDGRNRQLEGKGVEAPVINFPITKFIMNHPLDINNGCTKFYGHPFIHRGDVSAGSELEDSANWLIYTGDPLGFSLGFDKVDAQMNGAKESTKQAHCCLTCSLKAKNIVAAIWPWRTQQLSRSALN